MKYGFAIDNRKCIGCHACTTACKSENEVPLGVNRTWVKAVEKGSFPNTRRYFQVTRCNHCANPPCVEICPVTAMYQRKDGIVEFDTNLCIGCKACMQACPYDAIYLDPETQTAAKCHFCSHRIDVGLEPACVVVCPVHAIVAGDLDDPTSEISHLVSREQVRVRKPEQGTAPKLFYLDAEESVIVPTAAAHNDNYMWAQRNERVHGGGALRIEPGRMASALVRAAYDVSHERPWGWQVPAYLWTKSIGAGAFMVAAAAGAWGLIQDDPTLHLSMAGLALGATLLTLLLLVADLGRKERFLRVLLHGQWKSWLTRGAAILSAYVGLLVLWLGGWAIDGDWMAQAAPLEVLRWTAVAMGGFTAIYTAFLFGQCEGRDLWQSPLLPAHLLAQAVLCGGAALIFLPDALGATAESRSVGIGALAIGLFCHGILLVGEFGIRHSTDNARAAARLITHGPFSRLFWGGAVGAGTMAPAVLIVMGAAHLPVVAAAALLALGGLLAYEWCYVMAGQSVANS